MGSDSVKYSIHYTRSRMLDLFEKLHEAYKEKNKLMKKAIIQECLEIWLEIDRELVYMEKVNGQED